MKKGKKGIVFAVVLVFVGAAVYLNWSYNRQETEAANIAEDEVMAETVSAQNEELFYEGNKTETEKKETSTANEQLDKIRLVRQAGRDEALSAFEELKKSEGIKSEILDSAALELEKTAKRTLTETEIESGILAKGYKDCVACLSDDCANITVAGLEEGLNSSSVAQITDIVMSCSEYTAQNIKISEIK